MSTFIVFVLLGLSTLGSLRAYKFIPRVIELKAKNRDYFSNLSALDLTCVIVFGPLVVCLIRILNKIRGR